MTHLSSMTGFGLGSAILAQGKLLCEIRSHNHRQLEIEILLPSAMQSAEKSVREHIKERIYRGKLHCSFVYQEDRNEGTQLDQEALDNLLSLCRHIAQQAKPASVSFDPLAVLRWPGIMRPNIPQQDASHSAAVLDAACKAVEQLLLQRQQEGQQIQTVLSTLCATLLETVQRFQQQAPLWQQQWRQRLLQRLQELASIEPDSQRLQQELALYLQRQDVTEEIDRLHMQTTQCQQLLQQDSPIGKQLLFLLQEMQREANTLGAKSIDGGLTAIDLKLGIEKMREQAYNVE